MRGEVAIGPSIYGVYVIDGSLCSRVYGSFINPAPEFDVSLVCVVEISQPYHQEAS